MPEQRYKEVFIFLDTDKHASPFDILMVADIFPDASILKYEDVTADSAAEIVYDAMFPRGPQGAKHTKIFINGRDFTRANEILVRIQKSMFSPFELSLIIDPRGSYSTASAAVAKTLESSLAKGLGYLSNKTVAILAGTGPVGQTAARLFVSEKATVTITSRSAQRASSLAAKINEESGTSGIRSLEAQTPEEIGKAIEGAEIVLSAGAAGTQLLPQSVLKEHGRKCKIVVDVNAIPPLGVEGLTLDADSCEILPHVFGIGALAVGKLKNSVEAELIRKATDEPKGVFDYKVAYEIAKRNVLAKLREKRDKNVESPKNWLP